MSLGHIQDFLKKQYSLVFKNQLQKETASEILSSYIKIDQKEFSFNRNTLILKTTPLKKTHILLYQEEILEKFKKTEALYSITKIN